MKKSIDKFKEHAGELKNEADIEEELEEDGINLDEAEKEHFEEENSDWE